MSRNLPPSSVPKADVTALILGAGMGLRMGMGPKAFLTYSGNTLLEEYFDLFSDPYTKNTWVALTQVVTDPQYLIEPLIMHAHFKKLPDASGWDPTPCRADEPR